MTSSPNQTASSRSSWQQLSSREVYSNAWISVTHDDVIRPDDTHGPYGVVTVRQPAVFIVAVDAEDHVVLINLDRYTTGVGWEVPAGGSDGDELEAAARRELLEETGISAEHWQTLGVLHSLNGVARAECHVFLASGLSSTRELPEDAVKEGIGTISRFTWREVGQMCRDGRIHDGESVAALGMAALTLGRWQ